MMAQIAKGNFVDNLTLSSLLMTKFCHDLAGPLGGIQNGIEFLSEDASDPETVTQATALLGLSSSEASARLQLFRQAYGTFQPQGSADAADLERHVREYFSKTKLVLEWQVENIALTQLARSAIWQMLVLAQQVLIYGGNLKLTASEEAGNLTISVTGSAPKLHADPDLIATLEGKPASPNAIASKLAHALYWVEFCRLYQINTSQQTAADQLKIVATLPT